jgi:hypothetical protein
MIALDAARQWEPARTVLWEGIIHRTLPVDGETGQRFLVGDTGGVFSIYERFSATDIHFVAI